MYKFYLFLIALLFYVLSVVYLRYIYITPENKTQVLSESVVEESDTNINPPRDVQYVLLSVTGDIMPGRYVNVQTLASKDKMWAYRNIGDLFKKSDVVFANLESPVTSDCLPKSDGMIFCAPEYSVDALKSAGISIVSLANNHILNQGVEGLNETIGYLQKYDVKYTGVNNPTYWDVNGIKIAFLGFDDVECNSKYIECMEESNVINDIENAKRNSEFVVVMYHWGTEYTHKPNFRQIEFAHMSIDHGADLVLGNHPHWYQKIEMYKGKRIMYSHGNFVFDQMWSENTRIGLVGNYEIESSGLKKDYFTPIKIDNYGQPRIMSEFESAKVLDNLNSISLTQ